MSCFPNKAIKWPSNRPKDNECDAAKNNKVNTAIVILLPAVKQGYEAEGNNKEDIHRGNQSVKPRPEIYVLSKDTGNGINHSVNNRDNHSNCVKQSLLPY